MNSIYIGDRPLDPPEDDECETCGGSERINCGDDLEVCPDCYSDSDPGEPNDPPDEG